MLVVGQVVDRGALEEPDVLQLGEVQLEVAAAGFELGRVRPRPFYGGEQVVGLELLQDPVHLGELVLELLRVERRQVVLVVEGHGEALGSVCVCVRVVFVVVVVAVVVVVHGLVEVGSVGRWALGLGLVDEGRGHAELALAQEVHGDGAVDQRQVVLHGLGVCGELLEGEVLLKAASEPCEDSPTKQESVRVPAYLI